VERRAAPLAALVVLLSLAGVVLAGAANPAPAALGAVTWPVSTLLVSEVQTGGASASDEFAEITNVSASAVDLAGLELVYVTSTGTTATRKASWSATTMLDPGRHLLVANASGIFAAVADATYSGGFAATGGAIVLRPIGGAPMDALGWGDATNTFVEGSPVAAPAAGSSVERKPGGISGNTVDTNANSVDWFVQVSPNPQNLAAPPVPAPGATPGPSPSPVASVTPAPTATPQPTAPPTDVPPTTTPLPSASVEATASAAPTAGPTPHPTPVLTAEPTAEPTPVPTAAPTVAPSPTPSPTASPEPTLEPTPVPTAEPTPTPEPTLEPTFTAAPTATPLPTVSILSARLQANGTTARISGVLTTALGALEAGRKAFVQDETGGIALYLDIAVVGGLPSDTRITVSGTLDDRFAERTLRVNVVDIVPGSLEAPPLGSVQQTGAITEGVEGLRVTVQGLTVGSPSELSDGLGLMVDDGSGAVRVIVGPDALGGGSIASGTQVIAAGPVGQRDSSGTGLAGYRVHATGAGDLEIVAAPSPSPAPTSPPTAAPTATPSPTVTPAPTHTPGPSAAPSFGPSVAPSASPSPTKTPSPTVTPAPSPTASPPGPTPPASISILEARGAAVGTVVTVSGVVTAEGGRLGLPPLIAIADGTGGIAVRVPDGIAIPARGAIVSVKGALADPYGQLELRPAASGFKVTGHGSLPATVQLTAANLGEATEGRLAELTGSISATPKKGTSGDLTIDATDAAGSPFRLIADGSSGIATTDLVKGKTYRLAGIVGQRASRKGALDGYRLYLRDTADIVETARGNGAGPGASGAPASLMPISTAIAVPDGSAVTFEAIVTAGVQLLDSSGRRIVVQDATGAIEVLLPTGTNGPSVGSRLRITGAKGHAWGAPRIGATSVAGAGNGTITPASLNRAPAERDEWLLVRISGTVAKVERLGDRWHAEVTLVDGAKAAVNGQAGAGIPSTAIIAGRRITVTGIVKRPYPTASDRRFAILPRDGGDVAIGPAGNGAPTEPLGGPGPKDDTAATDGAVDVTPDTDLAALADHVGQEVRVGGLIARLAADGFDLDDGTALAHIVLAGDMTALLPHLRAGEAVAATGTVELREGAPVVVVDDNGTLLRVGSLGQALPIGGLAADPAATDGPSAGAGAGGTALTADSTGLGPNLTPSSVVAMALLTVASVLMTLLRKRLLRHRLRTALVTRLSMLRDSEEAPTG
jgi:hypothetical protein